MKKHTIAATLMAFSSLCSTAVQADSLDYDFVQLGYAAGDYADIEPFDLKGPEFEASYELSHNLFITGKYRSADDKISQYTLDETNWQAGAGYYYNFRQDTVFDARLYYGEIDFKLSDSEDSAKDGTHFFSLAGNVRHQLTDAVELFGGLEVQKWHKGSNQKAYRLGAQYAFGETKQFVLGAEYTKFSDSEWCKLFARYVF